MPQAPLHACLIVSHAFIPYATKCITYLLIIITHFIINGSEVPRFQVSDFKHASVFRVLVGSYETLRKHAEQLAGSCDLLVCDEGHRLKAAQVSHHLGLSAGAWGS